MYKIFFLACTLLMSAHIGFTANTLLLPNTTPSMQTASFWCTKEGEKIAADNERIKTMNQTISSTSMCALDAFPDTVSSETLTSYLAAYQMDYELYVQGKPISAAYARELLADAQGIISPNKNVAYGIVVSRSNLRSFPTLDGAFGSAQGHNFDVWQETAVDPGRPAIILHYNTKGNFAFVQLSDYRGWLPANKLALTDKKTWLTYVEPQEFVLVTGKTLVLNQEIYQMGARLPLVKAKILVPTRNSQGYLETLGIPAVFNEALHKGYLPFTRNNLLRMAFRQLDAPYGWGGLANSVDCSSLAQDVYNTLGVHLPRNGDEQAAAFTGTNMEDLNWEERIKVIKALPPGSLLFTPYHVMLYLGERNGRPYMLHSIASYGAQTDSGNIYKNNVMRVIVSDVYILGGSGNSLLMQMTKAINYQ